MARLELLPERLPEVGELVQVRSRRWLVEEVVEAEDPRASALVRLACADDDAQGQELAVYWDFERDRQILGRGDGVGGSPATRATRVARPRRARRRCAAGSSPWDSWSRARCG